MVNLKVPLVVAFLAVGVYFLGLADFPPFAPASNSDMVLIVALSDSPDYGGNIMQLMSGTLQGIQKHVQPSALYKRWLMNAATTYGSPEGAQSVSVGVYIDNPSDSDTPRWAIGYAVDASYEDAKSVANAIGTIHNVKEPNTENVVRAVRVSRAQTLQATIPWRTILTPRIAPKLQWYRGFAVYAQLIEQGQISAPTCGPRHAQTTDCSAAMEVYVTGPNASRCWIDYVVLMGDTTQMLDDMYPEPLTPLSLSSLSQDNIIKNNNTVHVQEEKVEVAADPIESTSSSKVEDEQSIHQQNKPPEEETVEDTVLDETEQEVNGDDDAYEVGEEEEDEDDEENYDEEVDEEE